MWTSVPQIEDTSTRIRTSSGRGVGTATRLTTVDPNAGFSFTAAFIVPARPPSPSVRAGNWRRYFNFALNQRTAQLTWLREYGADAPGCPSGMSNALICRVGVPPPDSGY